MGKRSARDILILVVALVLLAGVVRAAVQIDVTAEGAGSGSTASPVVMPAHVEITFPNGTGSQTVPQGEPGFYAFARVRYAGNGPLTIRWQADGRTIAVLSRTLTYGTDFTVRSDETGVFLPTHEPGAHEVTLTLDNGTGRRSLLAVPTIRYFVTSPVAAAPTVTPVQPAGGARVAPLDLAFRWAVSGVGPVTKAGGTGDPVRYRVEAETQPPRPLGSAGTGWRVAGPADGLADAWLPALGAEVTGNTYQPNRTQAVGLRAGSYRWRVTAFFAAADPLTSDWVPFTLTEPPDPGGVFFRNLRAVDADAGYRTGVLAPPQERLIASRTLTVRQAVPAGRNLFLEVNLENSTFVDQAGLELEVADEQGLLTRQVLPTLPASAVVAGAPAGYFLLHTSTPWQVPLARPAGELQVRLKKDGGLLDTARLAWTAEVHALAGGFDFTEYAGQALPPPLASFPEGFPAFLEMAGFELQVVSYDPGTSPATGLSGKALVHWRGDASGTPLPMDFWEVYPDSLAPQAGALAARVVGGTAKLERAGFVLQLPDSNGNRHTVDLRSLFLDVFSATADLNLSTGLPVAAGTAPVVRAADVPVFNGGEFVAEVPFAPETPDVQLSGALAVRLAGGRLIADFSAHTGFDSYAADPAWTGVGVAGGVVRAKVRALPGDPLHGLFDVTDTAGAFLLGRFGFVQLVPGHGLVGEATLLPPDTAPSLLGEAVAPTLHPVAPFGFGLTFVSGVFQLDGAEVGGLRLSGRVTLPDAYGAAPIAFDGFSRRFEGSQLAGFETQPVTEGLPELSLDGFRYRPESAQLLVGTGAGDHRLRALGQEPRFLWPTTAEEFEQRAGAARERYAPGVGLHLEGGRFVAGLPGDAVGAFSGRIQNLHLRFEDSALAESAVIGVLHLPAPAGLRIGFSGELTTAGEILVPEGGLLAPPAEEGWPLDYWKVTLFPGQDSAPAPAPAGGSAGSSVLPPPVSRWREPRQDGAFVLTGPVDEGGVRGEWLYLDQPDADLFGNGRALPGVSFDGERIRIQGAAIRFDVAPEYGGQEFYGGLDPLGLRSLPRGVTGGGTGRPSGPPPVASSGDFRIDLDLYPDGNIGYDGDPRGEPRVTPAGTVGFLGIPFTPSGGIRFARYQPRAQEQGGHPQDLLDAVGDQTVGLDVGTEARAGPPSTPLVTFEGQLHFSFMGTREVRIQHTAAGARVPFISPPTSSCSDLLADNGIELPFGWELPEQDLPPNVVCGDSRGVVRGAFTLRFVNTFGQDLRNATQAAAINGASTGVWVQEGWESVEAQEFKRFLGEASLSVLRTLSLVGLAEAGKTADGTRFEKVSVGGGVNLFRALAAGLNLGRTGAKLGGALTDLAFNDPGLGERGASLFFDAAAFSSTLAWSLATDTCEIGSQAAAPETAGVTEAAAGACAPFWEEFKRQLVADGGHLTGSAVEFLKEFVEFLPEFIREQTGIRIDFPPLPADVSAWLDFGTDLAVDLSRSMGTLAELERVPPEEVLLAVFRAVDDALRGWELAFPAQPGGTDTARLFPLGIHLPVQVARPLLETGGLSEADIWRLLHSTVDFGNILGHVPQIRQSQPLVPLATSLAKFAVDTAEEVRASSQPQVDLQQLLALLRELLDTACQAGDRYPEQSAELLSIFEDETGLRGRDLKTTLALSRRVLASVGARALATPTPDPKAVINEVALPLLDDLTGVNAGSAFCAANPGYDPYQEEAVALLQVAAQALRVVNVTNDDQGLAWSIETARVVARADNAILRKQVGVEPFPPLVFTFLDDLEAGLATAMRAESSPPVTSLKVASAFLPTARQLADQSGVAYAPEAVEVAAAVLAGAVPVVEAIERGALDTLALDGLLGDAGRLARNTAALPIDPNSRLALWLLDRVLQIASREVADGPAVNPRHLSELARESLDLVADLAPDEPIRESAALASRILAEADRVLAAGELTGSAGPAALGQALLRAAAELGEPRGDVPGLLEGLLLAASRLGFPGEGGLGGQTDLATRVLAAAMDGDLPLPARGELEAALGALARLRHLTPATFELVDPSGLVIGLRRVLGDGTVEEFNRSEGLLQRVFPSGRREVYAVAAIDEPLSADKLLVLDTPLEALGQRFRWDKSEAVAQWTLLEGTAGFPGYLRREAPTLRLDAADLPSPAGAIAAAQFTDGAWTNTFDGRFVSQRGPDDQFVKRRVAEGSAPVGPDGRIDTSGPVEAVSLRMADGKRFEYLSGNDYALVRGSARVYRFADPSQVLDGAQQVHLENGELVFVMEEKPGGYIQIADRDQKVVQHLFHTNRIEVFRGDIAGGDVQVGERVLTWTPGQPVVWASGLSPQVASGQELGFDRIVRTVRSETLHLGTVDVASRTADDFQSVAVVSGDRSYAFNQTCVTDRACAYSLKASGYQERWEESGGERTVVASTPAPDGSQATAPPSAPPDAPPPAPPTPGSDDAQGPTEPLPPAPGGGGVTVDARPDGTVVKTTPTGVVEDHPDGTRVYRIPDGEGGVLPPIIVDGTAPPITPLPPPPGRCADLDPTDPNYPRQQEAYRLFAQLLQGGPAAAESPELARKLQRLATTLRVEALTIGACQLEQQLNAFLTELGNAQFRTADQRVEECYDLPDFGELLDCVAAETLPDLPPRDGAAPAPDASADDVCSRPRDTLKAYQLALCSQSDGQLGGTDEGLGPDARNEKKARASRDYVATQQIIENSTSREEREKAVRRALQQSQRCQGDPDYCPAQKPGTDAFVELANRGMGLLGEEVIEPVAASDADLAAVLRWSPDKMQVAFDNAGEAAANTLLHEDLPGLLAAFERRGCGDDTALLGAVMAAKQVLQYRELRVADLDPGVEPPTPEEWERAAESFSGFAGDCLTAPLAAAKELLGSGELTAENRGKVRAAVARANGYLERFPTIARYRLRGEIEAVYEAYEARLQGIVNDARGGRDGAGRRYRRILEVRTDLVQVGPDGQLTLPRDSVRTTFVPYEARVQGGTGGSGGSGGCMTCHFVTTEEGYTVDAGLSEQEVAELVNLLAFVHELGEVPSEFCDARKLRVLVAVLFNEALASAEAGSGDVPSNVNELVRLLGVLQTAGVMPADLPASAADATAWAWEGMLRAKELEYLGAPPPTLANLGAFYHLLADMGRAVTPALLAASETYQLHAARFDDDARQFVDDSGQVALIATNGDHRDFGLVLELLAELDPADPGQRAVLRPEHAVAPALVDQYRQLAVDMLRLSTALDPAGAVADHEAVLAKASGASRRAVLAAALEQARVRGGQAPGLEAVAQVVRLADAAERLGAADIAAEARAWAAGAARQVRAGVAGAAQTGAAEDSPAFGAELLALDAVIEGLSASADWRSSFWGAVGLPVVVPTDPAALLQEVLLHVRNAISQLSPSRERGLLLSLEAALGGGPAVALPQRRVVEGFVAAGGERLVAQWLPDAGPVLAALVRDAVGMLTAASATLPEQVALLGVDTADALSRVLGGGGLPAEVGEVARVALPPVVRAALHGQTGGLQAQGTEFWVDEILTPAGQALARAPQWPLKLSGQSLLLLLDANRGGLTPEAVAGRSLALGVELLSAPEVAGALDGTAELRWARGTLLAFSRDLAGYLERGDILWIASGRVLGSSLFAADTLEGDLYGWSLGFAERAAPGFLASGGVGTAVARSVAEAALAAEGVPALTCVLSERIGLALPPPLVLAPFVAAGELLRDPALLQSERTAPQAGLNVTAGVLNLLFSPAAAACPTPAGVSLAQDTPFGGFVRSLKDLDQLRSEYELVAKFLIDGVRAAEQASGDAAAPLATAFGTLWNGPATVDYGNGPVPAGPTGLKSVIDGDADYLEVALAAPASMQAVYDALATKLAASDPLARRLITLLDGTCSQGAEGLLFLPPDTCHDRIANLLLALLEDIRVALVFLGESANGGTRDYPTSRTQQIARARDPNWAWGWLKTTPFREENGFLSLRPEGLVSDANPLRQKVREAVGQVDIARWVIGKLASLPSLPEYENPGEAVLAQSPLGAAAVGGRGFSGVAGGWAGLRRPDGSEAQSLIVVGNLEFPVLGAAAAQVMYNVETEFSSAYPESSEYLRIHAGAGVPEKETLQDLFGDGGNTLGNLVSQVGSLSAELDAKLGPGTNQLKAYVDAQYFGFDLARFVLTGSINLAEDSPQYLHGELCSALTAGVPILLPNGIPLPAGALLGGEGRLWYHSAADAGLGLQATYGAQVGVMDLVNIRAGLVGGVFGATGNPGTCGKAFLEGNLFGFTFDPNVAAESILYQGPGGPGLKLRYALPVIEGVVNKTFWLYLTPDAVFLPKVTDLLSLTDRFPETGATVWKIPLVLGRALSPSSLPSETPVTGWGGWQADTNFGGRCSTELTCGLQLE